ncbi:MAG: threalose-6-phosphate phosphatase [Geoglossum umbratile]|nr:MAG: threalose-6-phosphate phosphatase [Geoglossum umbratile]
MQRSTNESQLMEPPTGRPQSAGSDSAPDVHPALHPSITSIPVTPGVNVSGVSDYFEPHSHALSQGAPDSPSAAASGARSRADLLRRMSRSSNELNLVDVDPRAAHPTLGLSGGVISATFCIPYTAGLRREADWELKPRRGTSALFDSFSYLSSPATPWNHTLVGWTGEIGEASDFVSSENTSAIATTVAPLSKSSAPIPVDSSAPPPLPSGDGILVSKADRNRLDRQLAHDKSGRIVPIWMLNEAEGSNGDAHLKDQVRWRRYAEHELYPLFHYKIHEPTDGRSERKWWADYYRLNQKFAERILEIYKLGDIVVIHDYHLLLLPSILRQHLPHVYTGFFLHVPFPSSEFLRCLSRRKEVLEGVLGANMVGFQSYSYSRHFSSSCTRILGFDSSSAGVDAYGAHVAVDVFAIGIDATAVERIAYGDTKIEEKMAAIRELYAGKKIIVGRDRLDSMRGVAQKLMAFEMFLEEFPEWRDKVVLIQVTSPGSLGDETDHPEKTQNKVSELVARINGLYGSLSFSPVQHYPQYLSKDEYFALLRVADVGLITSVRDGMNTTSLEYVVCQKDHHGPLILSEFSGTAGSLNSAVHINPWDTRGVAEAIHHALTMSPEDKQAQQKRLYKHATTNTVQSWSRNFLKRLLTNLSSFDQSIATPTLDKAALLAQYLRSKQRLFMFDYDGTLTPIVKDPSAAIPTDRVVRNLKALASDPRNSVWIISGRDQNFLNQWMGDISELGLSAEHGSFIRHPQSEEWINLTEKFDMSWQMDVMEIFRHYTERTQGSFIERKRCALTWHYRRADPEYGAFQSRECQKHLENTVTKKWEVEVMTGKANLEVRPTFVNKGEIAKKLVEQYGDRPGEAPDFVLCLGDDFTDEDMFRSLRASKLPREHVFSVTVGASSKMTLASWHLPEPADVVSTIALLNGTADAADLGAQAVAEGKSSLDSRI